MQPSNLTLCLLVMAFCAPALAQQDQPIHLQAQPFVLQVREGYACNFENQGSPLTDTAYRGEKQCRITSQASLPGETGKVLFYSVAAEPDSLGVMDRGYVVPHDLAGRYLVSSGPQAKSRRLAICLPSGHKLQVNYGVNIRAAVDKGEENFSSLCTSSGSYIQSFIATADMSDRWTNLAMGPDYLDGDWVKTPYLIQFRILLPSATP
ncbi:hypothetical protein SAMN05216350_101270 [Polaromonas sp. YR568]|uniref:hypothetical protein n=1 Tax=Polaromonas sp. YR568 TaxID=1855301 RepID=UPI0008E3DEF8|nr:hypothetical protein [Polaromonas sp. YR568]SFU31474.1 hypothetical protein SAMN05216350_101270 [Polaromonas sp. YR568]